MRNVLIVSPTINSEKPTANGLCVVSLAKALSKQGFFVDIVCTNSLTSNIDGSIFIHSIRINEKKKKFFSNKYNGKASHIIVSFLKLLGGSLFSYKYDKELANSYFINCKELCKKKRVDVVIAVYFPLETIVAIKKTKKLFPHIKTVSFELDHAFSFYEKAISSSFIQIGYRRTLSSFYKFVDKIIVMRGNIYVWQKEYKKYIAKLCVSDIPVLDSSCSTCTNIHHASRPFTILFSGLLDKNFRNPQPILEILNNKAFVDRGFRTFFYSKGDCEDILLAISKINNNIIQGGFIPKHILDKKIEEADFLLNIGNLNCYSVPSKLIMYLSTGKPIIHFAFDKNDSCLFYLNKYPLSLILYNTDSVKINANKLICFMDTMNEKSVDFNTVSRLFPMNLPDYSCKIIEDFIEK